LGAAIRRNTPAKGCVGNPALSPFEAWGYDNSPEWCPDADTMLSEHGHRQQRAAV